MTYNRNIQRDFSRSSIRVISERIWKIYCIVNVEGLRTDLMGKSVIQVYVYMQYYNQIPEGRCIHAKLYSIQ